MSALTQTDCPDLTLLARGKVRDIYSIAGHDDVLLFVATDRVSAFDAIMKNGIPYKGQLLSQLSEFWFAQLSDIVPNHLVTADIKQMPAVVQQYADQLKGRTMLVRKCQVLKCEAIVRGYLTGSAYSEYCKSGTVHGIKLPEGLPESAKLPQPLFTPSTKAEVGDKDENVHPDQLRKILQYPEIADELVKTAIALYTKAATHAESAGLILADTKFEFGVLRDPSTNKLQLILIDEALTPDSSRFWPADEWAEGKRMAGFDKQFLREWLVSGREDGKSSAGQAVQVPEDVIRRTSERYEEAFKRLTGSAFQRQ